VANLKDVARETGLGLGTVSRALSGHPSVRPETRRRVEIAARNLGYQSNGLARALRRNQSDSIGLIIPDLENEFYTTAASVVQGVLAEEGYRLVLCCSDNLPDVDLELLGSLIQSRVDGIAHVPCTAEGSDAIRSLNPHLPIVEYARRSSARNVDSVLGDDERGSAELIHHLVGLGHRRIAMIAGPHGLSTTEDRVAGFRHACDQHGITPDEGIVLHGPAYDAGWGEQATFQILDAHPETTAIFASSSRGALGSLKALHARGVDIPSDMSIVGFLNPAWLDVCDPPLTTYELPLNEMGDMTARLLLRRIRNPSKDEPIDPNVVRFQGRLIMRASTSTPRDHQLR
jgi:LacI family transcriptional regulator